MSTEPSRIATRRIAVALDASDHGLRLLELAAGVAALLEAELEGIFVEDTQLLSSAGLPFLRELRLATLDEPALDVERLQREMRAVARRVREALEQSARTCGVTCSFRVWRGDLEAEILAAAVDAELFALGRIGRFAPLGKRLKGTRPRRATGDLTVGVLFDGSEAAARALATAAELAYDRRAAVSVILQPQDGADRDALSERASAILTGIKARTHVLAPESAEPGTLARTVLDAGIDLLIVDSANPLLAAPTLWERLESIDCPLLIHRSGV
jgi:hypothetical protein